MLRNLGYVIRGDSVDRARAVPQPYAIDAAMYVAHSFHAAGEIVLGKPYEALAKEIYQTMNGELRGFEKRYG